MKYTCPLCGFGADRLLFLELHKCTACEQSMVLALMEKDKMSHPETCPVCEGSGKALGYPSGEIEACYGCEGKGWVLAHDEELNKLKRRVSKLETELNRVDRNSSSAI